MYAVIKSGSKQYRVKKDDVIDVELLGTEKGPVEFKEILLLKSGETISIGAPLVKGCTVKGEVLEEVKAKKVLIFKYKRRKNCRKKQGHRQRYTRVKITSIEGGTSVT